MKNMNYKKMLIEINEIVENDWAYDVTDGHIDLKKSKPKAVVYTKFSQKEAQEMSEALTEVYKISHGLNCVCGQKYRR